MECGSATEDTPSRLWPRWASAEERTSAPKRARATRPRKDQEPVEVLADAVRRVINNVEGGKVTATTLATFQAVAMLVRELRAEAKAIPSERARNAQMRRVEGVAESLARTAARNASLLKLLTDDATLVPGTKDKIAELRAKAGMTPSEVPPEPAPAPVAEPVRQERQVVPQSVIARQLANPFLAPDFTTAPAPRPRYVCSPTGSSSARSCAPSRRPPRVPRPAWSCPSRPVRTSRRDLS